MAALLLHTGALLWLLRQPDSARLEPTAGSIASGDRLSPAVVTADDRVFDVTELSIEVPRDDEQERSSRAANSPSRADQAGSQPPVSPDGHDSRPSVKSPAQFDAVAPSVEGGGQSAEANDGKGSSAAVDSAMGDSAAVDSAAVNSGNGPQLSLRQMGIGAPNALVLAPLLEGCPTPAEQKQSELQSSEQRLATVLAQGQLDQDSSRGLSGGTWLTSAINQAAMGVAPERSKARFSVLTDARGLVLSIDVLESNANIDAWRKVAERALTDLGSKRRHNPIARPIRTLIDVESRVSLPSGRSPGTGVSLLNIPLKRREHKDSPNIELLSLKPTLMKLQVPDPSKVGTAVEVPVPFLQVQLLGINGDLVDIGSVGRQVVHSHVVREEVQ